MKLTTYHQSGLSRVEVIFLAAVPILLFFFVVPCTLVTLRNSHCRAMRVSCASHLKQISLSMQLFANDHDGRLPWMNSTNRNGSQELTNAGTVFRHFLAASNEIVSSKLLSCPMDSGRQRTDNFAQLSDTNLSYFLSLDARSRETNKAESILAGDRNILGGTTLNSSLRVVRKSDQLAWSKEIHREAGNVALVDGSVLQVDDAGLNNAISAMTNGAIRLAIP